jgi:hypothetical protein
MRPHNFQATLLPCRNFGLALLEGFWLAIDISQYSAFESLRQGKHLAKNCNLRATYLRNP